MGRTPRLTLAECQPVFDDISCGSSLRRACAKVGRPKIGNVLYAITRDPSIFEQYTRAISSRAHYLAEEVLEISDEEPDAQKAKNRIDARKWYAGKVNRALYGEKSELTVKAELTEDQLDQAILDLTRKLGIVK